MTLSLFGKGFALTDASGKAVDIDRGTSIPIQIPPGQGVQPIAFTFTVSKP